MSTEKLDRYKVLYSDYISHFVELHNYHQLFLDYPSYESGARVRKAITSLIKVEKALRKISLAVSVENKKNVKAGHMAAKHERARLKALPKKRGRPLKGKTNVINTTN